MNKIKTLYITASKEIKQSKLNETFVVSSPYATGFMFMYGKKVFTPDENGFKVLTETKANPLSSSLLFS